MGLSGSEQDNEDLSLHHTQEEQKLRQKISSIWESAQEHLVALTAQHSARSQGHIRLPIDYRLN
jgi:hypothetical protein